MCCRCIIIIPLNENYDQDLGREGTDGHMDHNLFATACNANSLNEVTFPSQFIGSQLKQSERGKINLKKCNTKALIPNVGSAT